MTEKSSEASKVQPQIDYEEFYNRIKGYEKELSDAAGGLSVVRNQVNTEFQNTKEKSKEFQQQVEIDKAAVAGAVKDISQLKDDANIKSGELNNAHGDLKKRIDETNKSHETLRSLVEALQKIRAETADAKKSAETDVGAIGNVKTQFETLRNEAQNRATELQNAHKGLEEKIAAIQHDYTRITKMSQELLSDKKDEANGNTILSVQSKIKELQISTEKKLKEINDNYTIQQEEFSELKETLTQKIESLLPGATAAGLASSFYESKIRYGQDPLAPIDQARNKKGKDVSILFYYILFVTPLIAVTAMFWEIRAEIGDLSVPKVLYKTTLFLPMVALSIFGLSSIQMSRRLYEEYNHKQRIMQLFYGFKAEINNHGDPEQVKKLFDIMLEAVEGKPTLAMTKYERSVWPDIFSRFFGKKEPADPTA